MLVSHLCRYSNQDAHRLLGVERLTHDQMLILSNCTAAWMEKEVAPLDDSPEDVDD